MANRESKEVVKQEAPRTNLTLWDVDKLFDDMFRRPFSFGAFPRLRFPETAEFSPSVDIYEEKNDVVLKAELPGLKKEDIEVKLTGDTITVSGEKKKEEKVEKKDYYRWECSHGSFTRTFTLPADIQLDKIKSTFKDGILEVRMPKTEAAKTKEVKVKID